MGAALMSTVISELTENDCNARSLPLGRRPVKGFTWVWSKPWLEILDWVGVTDRDKHASLLWHGINKGCKKFCDARFSYWVEVNQYN